MSQSFISPLASVPSKPFFQTGIDLFEKIQQTDGLGHGPGLTKTTESIQIYRRVVQETPESNFQHVQLSSTLFGP